MKNTLLFFLAFAFPFLLFAQKQTVLVYNFHGNHRCPGCFKIEELTKKAVDSLFANEVKSKKLIRATLNFEEEINIPLAEKLEVSTSALVVFVVDSNGKEIKTDLTDWAFTNVWDESKFLAELKIKIEEALVHTR